MPDNSAKASMEAVAGERIRRAVPRYNLIAAAEIIDPKSQIRLAGRISEISRQRSFVDLLNTLPRQTAVRIRICRDQGDFECLGKIPYEMDRMGVGVGFVDTPPDQLQTLDSWISELPA